MKKKIAVLAFLVFFISGCNKEVLSEKMEYENITYQETNKEANQVLIHLEDDRKILLELYPDVAPKTVANFKKLVANDFYNDVIFHRVIKGFVIQAGDASHLGRVADTIQGEFSANGISNDLSHERGVISMARNSVSMDSANSQFFIMHEDNPSLDGQYAAFGRVIAGMDVVDAIASVVTDSNDKPLKDIKIKSMEFIKVVNENE